MPIKSNFCHEFAVRMVLGCIDRHANTHGRFIEPLLSVQMDFYVSRCYNMLAFALLPKARIKEMYYSGAAQA